VRRFAIASLVAFASITIPGLRSSADDNLTLDLPRSFQAEQPSPPARAGDEIVLTGSKQQPAPKKPAPRPAAGIGTRKFASRSGQTVNGTKVYTVGRLGVANQTAVIRASRSSSRRALSKVEPGTYVALNCENGAWYGVLMADRSTGWIRKSDIRMLDYEVVSNRQSDATVNAAGPSGGYIDSSLLNGAQKSILEFAYGYLGVPYRWGGTSPSGLDCSALVQRCFGSVGIHLPRTAREQIAYGMPVSTDQLQTADRLYFANSSGDIVHTGIYIGNGYFIHASSRHKGVAVSRLTEDLYTRMYAGARR
jgi:cell wall-associated NlpC family hydrolase